MTRIKHVILLGLIITVGAGLAQATPPQDMASMLDHTGYNYKKIDKGVWEITFTGKNLPEFPVRIAQSDDLTILMCKIADRKDVIRPEGLYPKLLELNDSLDTVKFAMSKEMVYGRIDMHTRLVNEAELKYLLEQMSGAIDEAYPQIKQFLK